MKRQSTDHIFMIEPSEFYSNPQTAGSNHYQKSDNQRDKVKILEEAIEEFRAFRDKLVEAEINITTFKVTKVVQTIFSQIGLQLLKMVLCKFFQ